MTRLHTLLSWAAQAALGLACAALVFMASIQAWQVFARYVLNDSPSWSEPVSLLLMSTAMMLGAAAGVRASRHFGFFVLVESVPLPVQRVLRFVASGIAAATGLMFAVWGAVLAAGSWGFNMAGVSLPQGAVFLPMCVGGGLIALFALEQIVTPLKKDGV